MIVLQIISMLVLVFVIVMIYSVTVKLVNEHRELHSPQSMDEGQQEDQDNLDLTNKQ
jgi:uncharacterized membrane protein